MHHIPIIYVHVAQLSGIRFELLADTHTSNPTQIVEAAVQQTTIVAGIANPRHLALLQNQFGV